MKKPVSLWLSLAKELRTQRTPKRRVVRRHFDSGHPIDLRYDSQYHTSPAVRPSMGLSLSSASVSSDEWTRPFTGASPGHVESFEEEGPDGESEPPAWGTGELEEDEPESDGSNATFAAARSFSNDPDGPPVWGTGQLEELPEEIAPLASDPLGASSVSQPSATLASAPRALPNHSPGDDPDTAAFQADIAAILGGKKIHPSTQVPGEADPRDSEENDETSSPTPMPAAGTPATAASFSHDVFERMGHPLSSAQTFDLGSFALNRQLDSFDREMDRAERATRAPATRKATAPATAPTLPSELSASRSLNIRYEVPLVPQQTGMSCWAAGCAMIVGWRDQMSVDPAEIARATGAWAQYRNGLEPENASIFPVWGLTPEPPQSYSVEGFADLLQRYGPLWVASAEPGPHIRVVTGMTGDGTPDGTTLHINDPWENGMTAFRLPNAGSQTTETYTEFVRKQESLARAESHLQGIYVARNAHPRR